MIFTIVLGGAVPLFSFPMDFSNGNYLANRVRKVRAPELKGHRGWLNTEKPLSIAGLKGKVVLLDFWTYGCVNCIHIIPDLKFLEAKYEKNLVVIGVHSAKFKNEAETKNIRNIILRYGIEHPVVNDADYRIWDAYAVRAWPTQVLIDPEGYVIGRVAGEGNLELLDETIANTIETFEKKGKLDETPRKFALERAAVGELPLAFPGKILADDSSKRLFIADSNHNRIVVTDFSGKLIDTIGNGEASQRDGDFSNAGFNKPQGMAIDGKVLYVADTENHRIRKVDLKSRLVTSIAGTGTLSGFNGFGGDALETALRSPWDLEKAGKYLYVAMAGSHQIWRMDLERGYIAPYAGTRGESRRDGRIKIAEFAQPSGLVADGEKLFVADSESNIIREIDTSKEIVTTLVGGDLFEFGDMDGRGDSVRLQHPLGIETYDGKVLIADTYNHKIKILNPEKRTVKTFSGSGDEGQKDGRKASFYEPGGISVAGGKLFVADTNNHAVRVVDLETKNVSTLNIRGLKPPKEIQAQAVSPNLKEVKVSEKEVSIGNNSLILNVKLPKGFHLNPNAPQRYEVAFEGEGVGVEKPKAKFTKFPLNIPINAMRTGKSKLRAKLNIYYCREDNTGVCYIKTLVWKMPLRFTADKKVSENIRLSAEVD